jgi:fatty-acyl-CoA synthase/long-chain acyl-CoA synthetase
MPRHIRFVSQWPMSTSKIQKFRLRDQLAGEIARGVDA